MGKQTQLNALFLEKELHKLGYQVHCFDTIDSTNLEAKRTFLSTLQREKQVFLAREQTGGIGRFGRSFFSPKDKGLYMSFLLPLAPAAQRLLTIKAVLAVLRGIRRSCFCSCEAKWVNDIYTGQKKMGGILVQKFQKGDESMFAVGIGINLYELQEDFPEELRNTTTSLYSAKARVANMSLLAANIAKELGNVLAEDDEEALLEEYKAVCCILGKKILCRPLGQEAFWARALDIEKTGELLVETENGRRLALCGAEVSIKE